MTPHRVTPDLSGQLRRTSSQISGVTPAPNPRRLRASPVSVKVGGARASTGRHAKTTGGCPVLETRGSGGVNPGPNAAYIRQTPSDFLSVRCMQSQPMSEKRNTKHMLSRFSYEPSLK
ncbi:hypothetical protein RRG08_040168 [Elysia crispata]|uniref:Uncharacterized protein n=1 Tax=Elysia crispata TaxID=231223 RepID=A0AAE1CNQ8_9GAST|nr:hypothetical protein RRG08_040168 [Elysia crispata]